MILNRSPKATPSLSTFNYQLSTYLFPAKGGFEQVAEDLTEGEFSHDPIGYQWNLLQNLVTGLDGERA